MTKTAFYILTLIVLAGIVVTGCVDSVIAPDKIPPLIDLYTPKSNDTIFIGNQSVSYYASDDQKLAYIEVWVNNIKQSQFNINSDGSLPAITINFDSTYLNKQNSMYLLAIDGMGNSAKSREMTNIIVKESTIYNLSATALRTNQVELTWSANVTNALGFIVQRNPGDGRGFIEIGRTLLNKLLYIDSVGLTANTTYIYRVAAYFQSGISDWSSEKQVTTPAQDISPGSLTSVMTGSKKVSLSWMNNTSHNGTRIERKTGINGAYTEIGRVDNNIVLYVDTTVSTLNTYYYRVRGLLYSGLFTGYSNETSIYIPILPPNAPGSLTLTRFNNIIFNLNWTDNSDDEDGFELWRKDGDASGTIFQLVQNNIPKNSTSINDQVPFENLTYYYMIRAYKDTAKSAFSNIINSTGGTGNIPRPTSFTGSGTKAGASLSWLYSTSPNILGFKLERKISWGSYSQIALILPAIRQYSDLAGITTGVTYYYRIRAFTSTEQSDWSDEIQISIPAGTSPKKK
ncbi:MAG: hypothetical protein WCJ01_06200 [Ignavibacteria bacterium]